MLLQLQNEPAGSHLPQARPPVGAAREEELAVGTDCERLKRAWRVPDGLETMRGSPPARILVRMSRSRSGSRTGASSRLRAIQINPCPVFPCWQRLKPRSRARRAESRWLWCCGLRGQLALVRRVLQSQMGALLFLPDLEHEGITDRQGRQGRQDQKGQQ